MQREFIRKNMPSDWSVGQTIDYLRESKDLPEEFLRNIYCKYIIC